MWVLGAEVELLQCCVMGVIVWHTVLPYSTVLPYRTTVQHRTTVPCSTVWDA